MGFILHIPYQIQPENSHGQGAFPRHPIADIQPLSGVRQVYQTGIGAIAILRLDHLDLAGGKPEQPRFAAVLADPHGGEMLKAQRRIQPTERRVQREPTVFRGPAGIGEIKTIGVILILAPQSEVIIINGQRPARTLRLRIGQRSNRRRRSFLILNQPGHLQRFLGASARDGLSL